MSIKTGFEEISIVITPTTAGLNIQLEVKREGKDIRMVMPGMPVDRAQKVLDAISGSAARVVNGA